MATDVMAPPPPPGFVPPQAATAPPPPPPGFVPPHEADGKASPDEDDDGEEKPFSWMQFASDVGSGFKTSLNQSGETAMKIVGASGIPQAFNRQGWERSQAQTHDIAAQPLDSGGKMTGAVLENILEFVAGDEALKGASTAMKVSQIASVERALQKSPILTRMLGNAVRAQAVGTTQAAAHGATGGEAVAQGSLAAVGGAATEGVLKGAKRFLDLIRPTSTDVLGESLPTLASQKQGASPVAENIADIRSEPKTARAQQKGGQRAIVNRAKSVAASELHKLNAARASRWMEGEGVMNLAPEAEPIGPGRQLATGAPELPAGTPTGAPELEAGAQPSGMARTNEVGAYEGDFPPSQNGTAVATTPAPGATPPKPSGKPVKFLEEKPPNFASIDVDKEIEGVRSFGDAAELIRKHASPVFDTFDKATGGEYMRLREIRDAAYKVGDYKGVREAEKGIDDLFTNTRGKIDRTDYRTVRTAWRSSRILDAVHDTIEKSLNIADEGIAEDADVWRGINGGTLQRGLKRIIQDYGRAPLEDIIHKDGLTGLYRLSALTQTPQRAALYGEKAADVAHAAMADKRVGFIPSTIDWTRRALFHQIATSPRVASVMDYVVKHDVPASLAAKILVNVIGNTSRDQQHIEDEEVVPADEERGVKPVTLPVLRNTQ